MFCLSARQINKTPVFCFSNTKLKHLSKSYIQIYGPRQSRASVVSNSISSFLINTLTSYGYTLYAIKMRLLANFSNSQTIFKTTSRKLSNFCNVITVVNTITPSFTTSLPLRGSLFGSLVPTALNRTANLSA